MPVRLLLAKIPRMVTENLQKIAETGRVDKCTSTEYSTGTVHSTVPEYQYEYTVLVQYQYTSTVHVRRTALYLYCTVQHARAGQYSNPSVQLK